MNNWSMRLFLLPPNGVLQKVDLRIVGPRELPHKPDMGKRFETTIYFPGQLDPSGISDDSFCEIHSFYMAYMRLSAALKRFEKSGGKVYLPNFLNHDEPALERPVKNLLQT